MPVLRSIAAALARNSTHPISQAIAKLSAEKVDLKDWQEIRGAGVEGKAMMEDGGWKMARLGSLHWLKESGVDLAAGEKFIAEWSQQGATIVGLAVEQSLGSLFAVKDTVKPGAHAVIEQLHRQNLKTFLVTGDNSLTAASIARQAGIAAENLSKYFSVKGVTRNGANSAVTIQTGARTYTVFLDEAALMQTAAGPLSVRFAGLGEDSVTLEINGVPATYPIPKP